MIARLLPHHNRRGTTADKYCYLRLDTEAAWPRMSIVKNPAKQGLHLGPLPSRKMASLVQEALQTAVPLRRCTQRLGRNYTAPLDAPLCSVAHCPCSGTADPGEYAAAVEQAARAFAGDPAFVVDRLRERMRSLATQQRYEEAATTRDRLSAMLGAIRRTRLMDALGSVREAEVSHGETTWIIADGHLVDTRTNATLTSALPVGPLGSIADDQPVQREHADEALCLAKFFDKHAGRLTVTCTGTWSFPIASSDRIPPLERAT